MNWDQSNPFELPPIDSHWVYHFWKKPSDKISENYSKLLAENQNAASGASLAEEMDGNMRTKIDHGDLWPERIGQG